MPTTVIIEQGKQRVFACALDWPGWCRSARTEETALAALDAYAPRDAAVATQAGVAFPSQHTFEVGERRAGRGGTIEVASGPFHVRLNGELVAHACTPHRDFTRRMTCYACASRAGLVLGTVAGRVLDVDAVAVGVTSTISSSCSARRSRSAGERRDLADGSQRHGLALDADR